MHDTLEESLARVTTHDRGAGLLTTAPTGHFSLCSQRSKLGGWLLCQNSSLAFLHLEEHTSGQPYFPTFCLFRGTNFVDSDRLTLVQILKEDLAFCMHPYLVLSVLFCFLFNANAIFQECIPHTHSSFYTFPACTHSHMLSCKDSSYAQS